VSEVAEGASGSTPEAGEAGPKAAPPSSGWRRWWWAAVPAVAAVELLAQAVIQARVPREADWRAARAYIGTVRQEGDLVAAAPLWADPLARMHFAAWITLKDAARPDATRYPRALVATLYGAEHPDLRGWTEIGRRSFGAVVVRTLRNPAPARVLYDFVDHLRPGDAQVFRAAGGQESPCSWQDGLRVTGGGLGQGALAPPARFVCSPDGWNYVGATVIEDMTHRGRRCLWSHPVQGGVMVTEYPAVPMGNLLYGHHALAYEAERGDDFGNTGGDVELRVLVDGEEVGRSVHRDGEGWKAWQFDTRRFAGAPHRVRFEVRAAQAGMRHYCFEGDAR
jgi:hypothetical protein